jgi:HK97 family phage portal protein
MSRMGLLDRLFRKASPNNSVPAIFDSFTTRAAPPLKDMEYVRAYKGWVYACVNVIAEEVASTEIYLAKRTAEGWDRADKHPAMQLLRRVNPYMTSGQLFEATTSYLELEGNSFWLLIDNMKGSKPVEIWTLDPTRVTIHKGSGSFFIDGYSYRKPDGTEYEIDPSKIIHFKRFNPNDPYRGIGTVQAAALGIDIDNYSAEWNRNFFFNQATPAGVLETEKSLTPEQHERLKKQWEVSYQGLQNAHRTALLEAGLQYKQVTLSQRDMDFLESRRFTRDEICSIFRVPKALLGIAEDFNRANIEGIQYIFSRYLIKNKLQLQVDVLNEFYLPKFEADTENYRFMFADPVPANQEFELKRKETYIRSGLATRNEIRAEEGRKPLPTGGDDVPPIGGNLGLPVQEAGEKKLDINKAIQKAAHARIVEKRIKFVEQQIKKSKPVYRKIYKDMKDQLVNRLKEKKSIKKTQGNELVRFLFENWNDWIGIVFDPTKDILEKSVLYAGKVALNQVEAGISFDQTNPRVLDWLNENVLADATSIVESVKDDVALLVMEGVEQGIGAQKLAEGIEKYFDDTEEWKALRIARTEVVKGYAEGSIEGYRQSEIVYGKKWLTAGDNKVREEHQKNEAQGVVLLDEPFQDGENAPGEPNCRCVLQPVTNI